jgi:acetyl-CoA acetyltransferase
LKKVARRHARPSAAIVGVHTTRQAFSIDREPLSLCLEAAIGALKDAGMEKSEIDGIGATWPGPGGNTAHPGSLDWSTLLGVPLRWICDGHPAGVPGLMDACAAITSGLCETVLIIGGQSRRSPGSVVAYTRPENEFTACYGSYTAAQFALVAQRYFHKFGADHSKMAQIAADIRNMGSLRPDATLFGRGQFTAGDIMASPMVVEPFHLLELCLASDGAAAFVVTSLERARDCPKRPISVLGAGMEYQRQHYVDPPLYEEVWGLGSDAFQRATSMADVTRDDIDVFQLYDPNALEIARQFEAFGYCREGEGLDFVTERRIGVEKGRLPINTDGGLMSFGHIGWSGASLKVIEAVRQLRGEASSSQANDPQLALVSGAGSGAQCFDLAILGKDAP